MERRHAIAVIVASVLSACAPVEAVRPTDTQPQQDKKPATPTLAREKTLDERAKEGALNTWKEFLSSIQTQKDKDRSGALGNISTQLKMEIVNPDAWSNVFQQALKGKSNVPLKVRWIATEVIDHPTNGMFGTKWVGEAEFNNIAVGTASGPLSDADKANGIQWSGFAGVEFISKSRSVLSKPSGWVKNKEAFQRWISDSNPDQALPAFSPFQSDGWFTTELQFKNGQWSRKPHYSAKAGSLTKDSELPTSVLDGCDPKACKAVTTDIK